MSGQFREKNTGLILGKFLPFHNGHRHLIDSARRQVDELFVLVCTLKREIIPGEVRYDWMRTHYAHDPGVRVFHNTDENPQEPEDHPDFWDIWDRSIRRFFPDGVLPDVLFSSENYGFPLADRLGIRHTPIDISRSVVPVSGTAIRAAPYRLRSHLPDIVRPYFVKKIVITGPESCGKTTLAARLAERFATVWAPEYAREYLETNNVHIDNLRANHIPPIARGHAEQEDRLTAAADGVLFLDTDLIVTKIYSQHYFGDCPDWICDEAARRARKYDLQILLTPDSPWVADNLRNLAHERLNMFHVFESELNKHDARYHVLSLPDASGTSAGDHFEDLGEQRRFNARFDAAVALVQEILQEPLPA